MIDSDSYVPSAIAINCSHKQYHQSVRHRLFTVVLYLCFNIYPKIKNSTEFLPARFMLIKKLSSSNKKINPHQIILYYLHKLSHVTDTILIHNCYKFLTVYKDKNTCTSPHHLSLQWMLQPQVVLFSLRLNLLLHGSRLCLTQDPLVSPMQATFLFTTFRTFTYSTLPPWPISNPQNFVIDTRQTLPARGHHTCFEYGSVMI